MYIHSFAVTTIDLPPRLAAEVQQASLPSPESAKRPYVRSLTLSSTSTTPSLTPMTDSSAAEWMNPSQYPCLPPPPRLHLRSRGHRHRPQPPLAGGPSPTREMVHVRSGERPGGRTAAGTVRAPHAGGTNDARRRRGLLSEMDEPERPPIAGDRIFYFAVLGSDFGVSGVVVAVRPDNTYFIELDRRIPGGRGLRSTTRDGWRGCLARRGSIPGPISTACS